MRTLMLMLIRHALMLKSRYFPLAICSPSRPARAYAPAVHAHAPRLLGSRPRAGGRGTHALRLDAGHSRSAHADMLGGAARGDVGAHASAHSARNTYLGSPRRWFPSVTPAAWRTSVPESARGRVKVLSGAAASERARTHRGRAPGRHSHGIVLRCCCRKNATWARASAGHFSTGSRNSRRPTGYIHRHLLWNTKHVDHVPLDAVLLVSYRH